MELTTEQQEIINEINNQILVNGYERNRYYAYPFTRTIVGYAGTGKTTLIAELRKQIKERFPKLTVAFLTFTGKASSVLKSKLIDNNSLFDDDYIGTFHSLMYIPETIYDKKLKHCHKFCNKHKQIIKELYGPMIMIDLNIEGGLSGCITKWYMDYTWDKDWIRINWAGQHKYIDIWSHYEYRTLMTKIDELCNKINSFKIDDKHNIILQLACIIIENNNATKLKQSNKQIIQTNNKNHNNTSDDSDNNDDNDYNDDYENY